MARVELARRVLDFDKVAVANVFALATYRTSHISGRGSEPAGWLLARPGLEAAIAACDGVVLAYGMSEPSGIARYHHREQVQWLHTFIDQAGLPSWWVGGSPRHPSRWHRFTHRAFPEVEFGTAIRSALTRRLLLEPVARG